MKLKKIISQSIIPGASVALLMLTATSASALDTHAISGQAKEVVVSGYGECWESLDGVTGKCGTSKIVISGVNFEFDSANLTGEGKATLDKDAEALKNSSANELMITGHTDSVGSDAYNQGLSERRAASVAQYLSAQGVDAPMSTSGMGESQPVASNDTAEGRAANRRVEIDIK